MQSCLWREKSCVLAAGCSRHLLRAYLGLHESGDLFFPFCCVAPGNCLPSLSSSGARSFLLAPSPQSGTQAACVSSSCALCLNHQALKTSFGNNLDFGMPEALPQGTPRATAQQGRLRPHLPFRLSPFALTEPPPEPKETWKR